MRMNAEAHKSKKIDELAVYQGGTRPLDLGCSELASTTEENTNSESAIQYEHAGNVTQP